LTKTDIKQTLKSSVLVIAGSEHYWHNAGGYQFFVHHETDKTTVRDAHLFGRTTHYREACSLSSNALVEIIDKLDHQPLAFLVSRRKKTTLAATPLICWHAIQELRM